MQEEMIYQWGSTCEPMLLSNRSCVTEIQTKFSTVQKVLFFFFSWKFLRDLCFPFYLINFYKNVFSVLCANIVIISLNCLLILREDGWNVFILTKKEIINLQSPTHNSLFSYLVRFWEVGWAKNFSAPHHIFMQLSFSLINI